jgi:hypothetical protein
VIVEGDFLKVEFGIFVFAEPAKDAVEDVKAGVGLDLQKGHTQAGEVFDGELRHSPTLGGDEGTEPLKTFGGNSD